MTLQSFSTPFLLPLDFVRGILLYRQSFGGYVAIKSSRIPLLPSILQAYINDSLLKTSLLCAILGSVCP